MAALAVVAPAALFLALFFARPAWGLAFFVVARGAADAFSELRLDAPGASLNPAAALGLAALLAAAARAPRMRREDLRSCAPFAILLAVVLYEGAVGLAGFGVGHASEVVRELLRYASIPAVFALARTLPTARERNLLYGAVVGALALCAAWGIAQFVLGAGVLEATSGVRRARGPFAFPNTLAYAALLGLALLGGELFFGAAGRARRGALLAAMALFVVALVLTASLTVFALALLAAALFMVLKRRTAPLAVVVVLVLAASPLLAPRLAMLRASRPDIDLADGFAQNTLTARLEIWRGLLSVYRERPLCGWGLRSVPRVNPVQDEARGVGSDPHNDLVLFLVEGGALGLAGLVVFHLWALRMLARLAAGAREPARCGRATGLWVMYACMLAGSLGNNLMSFTALLVLFWAAAGACREDDAAGP
jgi:O-antigen ligase